MDEAGRTTQSPLIMAPPDLKADPDEVAADPVVDNGIMSPPRRRTGNSRSASVQRSDDDANGANGSANGAEGSRGDFTGGASAVTEVPHEVHEATEAGMSAVPLPADTIGDAKTRPSSGERTDEGQDSESRGSRQTMASGENTDSAASGAVASDATNSLHQQPGQPAPASYARSEWPAGRGSTTTAPAGSPGPALAAAPAGSATRNDYPSGNGFPSGAASTAGGMTAGAANSGASPWRNRAGTAPRGFQARKSSKRQAMLTLSRVEPWSVMKFSFVASVVAFIILFVAVALLYMVLAALGVFDSLQNTVSTVTSSQGSGGTNISHWFSASLILGYTAMLGALNIVLITAMSTVGSVVYNLIAKTVGGIEVTLRETD